MGFDASASLPRTGRNSVRLTRKRPFTRPRPASKAIVVSLDPDTDKQRRGGGGLSTRR